MLGDVSPVVQALAHTQFDNYVKQVRIFIHPRLADHSDTLLSAGPLLDDLLDPDDD
tara:strand:- start:460 stop:627 length:168 start_codon:yes stop_codon:yes gene_type:complete